MPEQIESVIIGGGHAGLAVSYWLTQRGHEHLILERRRLAERWRSERWDSLTLLTPNWASRLPGFGHPGTDPDAFASRDELIQYFDAYAASFKAPARCGVAVTALRQTHESRRYLLETSGGKIESANVVVATGPFQQPVLPAMAADLPANIQQLHSSQYRAPDQLVPGGVLVVGTGSSGFQIAEELNAAGRSVYLSVGRYLPAPRRYRGKDTVWWGVESGLFDRTVDSLPSPAAKDGPSPALTGVGGGHDLDLHSLAAQGVVLLGHTQAVQDGVLRVADDLATTMATSNAALAGLKQQIDAFIRHSGIDAPEEPGPSAGAVQPTEILELPLQRVGVTSVVWSTGFKNDFGWVHLPVLDARGEPIHRRGETELPGMYFLGLRWLHRWKSSFIMGAGEDAAYLAEQIAPTRGEMSSWAA